MSADSDVGECVAETEHATKIVRVGLLGYGRVGQAVAALAKHEQDRLAAIGLELRCAGALVRDRQKARGGPVVPLSTSVANLFDGDVDVVVEVLGGVEPARTLVADALAKGIPVITANKSLIAAHGEALSRLAARHGTVLAFDAAVLAGVPFLGSLARRPLASAATRLEGVVNGTSHFIVTGMARGGAFASAVDEAVRLGYAEPDSGADTGGQDAAEKLAILLNVSARITMKWTDLPRTGLEALSPADFLAARELGGVIKPIALASLDTQNPGAWIGPAFVYDAHPFARLDGVDNALRVIGLGGRVVTFAGPGAGPEATAITIVDDIIETITSGWQPPAQPPLPTKISADALTTPPAGRWYVRLSSTSARPADAAEFLAARGVPALRIDGRDGAIAALTVETTYAAIRDAATAIASIGGETLVLPALTLASGEVRRG